LRPTWTQLFPQFIPSGTPVDMPEQPEHVRARLAAAIKRRRGDIMQRWLERVTRDCQVSGVSLTDLRNALPDYLDKLQAELIRDQVTLEESGSSAWTDIAREHAVTRVRLGFDISQLVHEFIILRRVLQEIAEEETVFGSHQEPILAELVEAAIAVAVQSYVQARDYEGRRSQAANIGFITHELRNPLNVAMLAASLLRPELTTDVQRQLVERIERNQRRLRELIDAVLDSQKLEAGQVRSQPSRLKLPDLLGEVVSSARTLAEDKGLRLEAVYHGDLELETDPLLTRSAVQNVLDNAIKYTDEGLVELTAEGRPDEVVIHVRDSCHGLSREELATIFEPFARGHTRIPGTGLGLAIARRAIETQGGRVEAESPGERGCHFWITLPRRPAR
jgi:signal transduction histidine kinase